MFHNGQSKLYKVYKNHFCKHIQVFSTSLKYLFGNIPDWNAIPIMCGRQSMISGFGNQP